MAGNVDSDLKKQSRPTPHPWVVAQANYMLSRPWDVPLWTSWWWATYLSTLQSIGVDTRAISNASWPEAYYKSLDIGLAHNWFGPDMAEILRRTQPEGRRQTSAGRAAD